MKTRNKLFVSVFLFMLFCINIYANYDVGSPVLRPGYQSYLVNEQYLKDMDITVGYFTTDSYQNMIYRHTYSSSISTTNVISGRGVNIFSGYNNAATIYINDVMVAQLPNSRSLDIFNNSNNTIIVKVVGGEAEGSHLYKSNLRVDSIKDIQEFKSYAPNSVPYTFSFTNSQPSFQTSKGEKLTIGIFIDKECTVMVGEIKETDLIRKNIGYSDYQNIGNINIDTTRVNFDGNGLAELYLRKTYNNQPVIGIEYGVLIKFPITISKPTFCNVSCENTKIGDNTPVTLNVDTNLQHIRITENGALVYDGIPTPIISITPSKVGNISYKTLLVNNDGTTIEKALIIVNRQLILNAIVAQLRMAEDKTPIVHTLYDSDRYFEENALNQALINKIKASNNGIYFISDNLSPIFNPLLDH